MAVRDFTDDEKAEIEALGRLGEVDGDAEEAPRGAEGTASGRQQMDRHRRHFSVRRLRLQPGRRAHRPGRRAQPQRREGLGQARIRQSGRQGRTRHAQHQDRAAPAAALRAARRPRSNWRWRIPSMPPHVAAAGWTSRCSAGAAQRREGAAAARYRRIDGRPRRRSARNYSPRRAPSSSISNTIIFTISPTKRCGATTAGGSTSMSARSKSCAPTAPITSSFWWAMRP